MSDNKQQEILPFLKIDPNTPVDIVKCFCPFCKCEEAESRMLLTKIPFFKEVIIIAFECPNCHEKNSETSFGGSLEDFGIRITVKIVNPIHLDRMVVKSEYATLGFPELGLEIPTDSQKGTINTIEGILRKVSSGLSLKQEERKTADPENYKKIEKFIEKVNNFASGKLLPLTLILDDPSGNSFVQNPHAPNKDQYQTLEKYTRTREQIIGMGFNPDLDLKVQTKKDDINKNQNEIGMKKQIPGKIEEKADKPMNQNQKQKDKVEADLIEKLKKLQLNISKESKVNQNISAMNMDFNQSLQEENMQEPVQIPTPCYACKNEGMTRMCKCSIPFFKELIIMCFQCVSCGYKSTEVKSGGGMSAKATRITFQVSKEEHLNRDLFKSETCGIKIPQMGLDVSYGSMGGLYSTVEGLIDKIYTNLVETNPFSVGDSAQQETFKAYLKSFQTLKTRPFTLIMDDPLSNSFLLNPNAPAPDPDMEIVEYERSFEQNEDLGLNDMKV